jgi:hypothetical protein
MKMQVFSKLIKSKEDISPSSLISMLKDMDKRLEQVEHELWNLRFAFNEMTDGKAQLYLNSGVEVTNNIDNKVRPSQKISAKPLGLHEDHLKEAREFIRTMVDGDVKDLHTRMKSREDAMADLMPHISDTPSPRAAAQNFMTSLDSEHLLDLFNRHLSVKPKGDLDNFLLQMGSDVRMRRMSSKDLTLGKQPAKKIDVPTLAKATKGKELILSGKRVCDLPGLYRNVRKLGTKAYSRHVAGKRNDLADWVERSLGYKRLAGMMRLSKSRDETLSLLKKSMSQ